MVLTSTYTPGPVDVWEILQSGGEIPDLILDRPPWMTGAACAGGGTETFFASYTAPAKKVCEHCPVRIDCLEWALSEEVSAGVWGGLSSLERNALRRRRVA